MWGGGLVGLVTINGYDQRSVYLESTEALITIKDPEPNFLKRDNLH